MGCVESACVKKGRIATLFIDYQKLNAVTMRDFYPTPRMDKHFDFLGEVVAFFASNANSQYWQVEAEETNRNKTVFTSHYELYRLARMSSGLENAPETFQRAMDVLKFPVKWKLALVYLDNIVVF